MAQNGKNVPEFAPMEYVQWRENTVKLLPKLKQLLLALNLFTVAFTERLQPLENDGHFKDSSDRTC
jgi:hypothetical protein